MPEEKELQAQQNVQTQRADTKSESAQHIHIVPPTSDEQANKRVSNSQIDDYLKSLSKPEDATQKADKQRGKDANTLLTDQGMFDSVTADEAQRALDLLDACSDAGLSLAVSEIQAVNQQVLLSLLTKDLKKTQAFLRVARALGPDVVRPYILGLLSYGCADLVISEEEAQSVLDTLAPLDGALLSGILSKVDVVYQKRLMANLTSSAQKTGAYSRVVRHMDVEVVREYAESLIHYGIFDYEVTDDEADLMLHTLGSLGKDARDAAFAKIDLAMQKRLLDNLIRTPESTWAYYAVISSMDHQAIKPYIEYFLSYGFTDWLISDADIAMVLDTLAAMSKENLATLMSKVPTTFQTRILTNLTEENETSPELAKVVQAMPDEVIQPFVKSLLSRGLFHWAVTDDQATRVINLLAGLETADLSAMLDKLPERYLPRLVNELPESVKTSAPYRKVMPVLGVRISKLLDQQKARGQKSADATSAATGLDRFFEVVESATNTITSLTSDFWERVRTAAKTAEKAFDQTLKLMNWVGGTWSSVAAALDFMRDFVKGLVSGLYDLVSGVVTLAANAIQLINPFEWIYATDNNTGRLQTLGDIILTLLNPWNWGKLLGAIVEPFASAWKRGDYGEILGRLIPEIATFFIGAKGLHKLNKVSKGTQVSKTLDNAADVSNAMNKADDLASAGNKLDDAAKLEKTADTSKTVTQAGENATGQVTKKIDDGAQGFSSEAGETLKQIEQQTTSLIDDAKKGSSKVDDVGKKSDDLGNKADDVAKQSDESAKGKTEDASQKAPDKKETPETPEAKKERQKKEYEIRKRERDLKNVQAKADERFQTDLDSIKNKKGDAYERYKRLSPEDQAYINPDTPEGLQNLKRASDPDRGLDTACVGEARAMELLEKQAEKLGPIQRSGAPGADVLTGTATDGNIQHWSMKALYDEGPEVANSIERILKEMTTGTHERMHNRTVNGVMVDLRPIKDPISRSKAMTSIKKKLDEMNQSLLNVGKEPVPVMFVLP